MTERNILINRAPVLTLPLKRLGFDQDEALSVGKAVAGLTAPRGTALPGRDLCIPQ
jgi:hypothetical protein